MDCIFCSIVEGKIPAKIHYEDDTCLVFEDIHPKAPIHLLIIPKQHLVSLAEAEQADEPLLGHMLLVAAEVARNKDLSGFKTQINTGRSGGQVVDHLHIHVLGGRVWQE